MAQTEHTLHKEAGELLTIGKVFRYANLIKAKFLLIAFQTDSNDRKTIKFNSLNFVKI